MKKPERFVKYLSITLFMILLLIFLTGTTIACRLYAIISDNIPRGLIVKNLKTYPNSLYHLSSRNKDGWGIAHYPYYGDLPIIERGYKQASIDPVYSSIVNKLNSASYKIIFAHARRGISGCGGPLVPNPHPFYRAKNGKVWIFAHNGSVSKTRLKTVIGTQYLLDNPPNGSDIAQCNPDDFDMVVDRIFD